MKERKQGTLFCLTIAYEKNKETIGDNYKNYIKELFNDNSDLIRYIICGNELGSLHKTLGYNMYKHLQVYIQLYRNFTFNQLKCMFRIENIHIEIQQAFNNEDARNYCKKESEFIEFGLFCKGRGFRKNYEEIKILLDKGEDHHTIASNPKYFGCYMRYNSWFYKYRQMKENKRYCNLRKKLNITVIFGEEGSGKTESIYREYGGENIFKYKHGDDNKNWNGYEAQKILIIDEFRGQIKFTELNEILDNKPYICRMLCNYEYAKWEKVYIISNKKPENWYTFYDDDEKHIKKSLYSRLDKIYEVNIGNTRTIFTEYFIKTKYNKTRHKTGYKYLDLKDIEAYENDKKSILNNTKQILKTLKKRRLFN